MLRDPRCRLVEMNLQVAHLPIMLLVGANPIFAATVLEGIL